MHSAHFTYNIGYPLHTEDIKSVLSIKFRKAIKNANISVKYKETIQSILDFLIFNYILTG